MSHSAQLGWRFVWISGLEGKTIWVFQGFSKVKLLLIICWGIIRGLAEAHAFQIKKQKYRERERDWYITTHESCIDLSSSGSQLVGAHSDALESGFLKLSPCFCAGSGVLDHPFPGMHVSHWWMIEKWVWDSSPGSWWSSILSTPLISGAVTAYTRPAPLCWFSFKVQR